MGIEENAMPPTKRAALGALIVVLVAAAFAPWHDRSSSAQSLTGTIPVGFAPFGVVVNATTNRVYVANQNGDDVSVLDGATSTTLAMIPAPGSPRRLALNEASNRLYVESGGSLHIVDGATNAVLTSVPLPAGCCGHTVAVNAATNRVYVTSNSTPSLTVIDGASGQILGPLTMDSLVTGVCVDASANRVFVATVAGIVTLDGETSRVVSTMPTPAGFEAHAVAVNPSTNRLYATSSTDPRLLVIDTSGNSVVATIASFAGNPEVVVNPMTNRVYTPGATGGLAIIDGATSSVITTLDLNGATIVGIGVNPVTNTVYGADINNSRVFVVDDSPPVAHDATVSTSVQGP
jgi:YVTN family beta-propeller protein